MEEGLWRRGKGGWGEEGGSREGVRDERIDRMKEGRGRMYCTYEGGGVRKEGEWEREGVEE